MSLPSLNSNSQNSPLNCTPGYSTFLEKLLNFAGNKGKPVLLSYYLGIQFGIGFTLIVFLKYYDIGYYLLGVSFFHLWEYLYVAIYREEEAIIAHFLVDHSIEFVIAYVFSYVEYFIELYFLPAMKRNYYVTMFGIVIMIIGQFFRTGSMIQLGRSFNHIIETQKRDDHKLTINGFYRFVRHPAYFGWFYWVIASQIVLANPFCFFGYFFVCGQFFKNRIELEEYTLIKFYGEQYLKYIKNVGVYIPSFKKR